MSHISRPSDVEGVYGAAGAGAAIGTGARAIVLTNEKGAVLELSGRETGLMVNADLRTLGRITESVLTESLQVRDAITATIGALISPSVLSGLAISLR